MSLEWLQEARRAIHDLPPQLRALWRNREPSTPVARAEHLRKGWPILPLSDRRDDITGLRILPARPWAEWPLVKGTPSDTTSTLSGSAATAVPAWFYWSVVRTSLRERSLTRKRNRWSQYRASLEPLHNALGGSPTGLDVVRAALFDPELETLRRDLPAQASFDHSVLVRLDSGETHRRFRQYLSQLFDQVLQAPDEDFGVWSGVASMQYLWRSMGFLGEPKGERFASMAWEQLHKPPQYDLDWSFGILYHHFVSSTGMNHESNAARMMVGLINLATDAEREAWRPQPLFQRVLLPLAEDRQGPWHLGFMEAAAAHDGLGEPELSWNMLCSGAFWVNRRGGPWRPFFDAALDLSRRHGWEDVVHVLEDQAASAGLD